MYTRVYSPDGEPFDVTRERADMLILQKGWTQTEPMPASKSEPVETLPLFSSIVQPESVEEPDGEELSEVPSEEEEESKPRKRWPRKSQDN